jgi:hypothetical protein
MTMVLILFVLARLFSRPKGKGRRRARPAEDDLMARMFVPVPIEENDPNR